MNTVNFLFVRVFVTGFLYRMNCLDAFRYTISKNTHFKGCNLKEAGKTG